MLDTDDSYSQRPGRIRAESYRLRDRRKAGLVPSRQEGV